MRGGRRRLCSPTPRTTNSAVATARATAAIAAGHSTFATAAAAAVGRSLGRSGGGCFYNLGPSDRRTTHPSR